MRCRRPRAKLLAGETRVWFLRPWAGCPPRESRWQLRACPVWVRPSLCEAVDDDDRCVWHEVQLLCLWLRPDQWPGHLCPGPLSGQRKSILQWATAPGRGIANDALVQPVKSNTRHGLIRQAPVRRIKRRLWCRFIWWGEGYRDLTTTQYAVLWRTRKLSVHHYCLTHFKNAQSFSCPPPNGTSIYYIITFCYNPI